MLCYVNTVCSEPGHVAPPSNTVLILGATECFTYLLTCLLFNVRYSPAKNKQGPR